MDHLQTEPLWVSLLLCVGFFSLYKHSIILLRWIFITFFRPSKNLKNYGSWALVTGPTEGIGKAFSFQLAQKGLNLLLVGRNPKKLKNVSSEVKFQFPETEIKVVVVDFSGDLAAGIVRIKDAIKGLDVGILINNVGVTYPAARFFHEVDEKVWKELIKVNIDGTTKVTKAVIEGMLERKRGAIVNIGSGAAIVVPSHPLYAIYAATKGYVDQLSRSLHVEYKYRGIDVQCQVPLYVATSMVSKMLSIKKSSLFIPSPDAYARAAIRRIGYESRCTPYWAHSLQWFLASFIPEPALDTWRFSIGLRRRGQIKK